MKKKYYLFFLILISSVALISCEKKSKSYAERLRDEIRIINRFIIKNGIIVLDKIPEDTIFKPNEFYKDPLTGVYINIIDKGGERKAKPGEEIYIRFDGYRIISAKNDSATYSTMQSENPSTLIYRGVVTLENKDALYGGTTPAWVVPLSFIGHKGRAKMIVPFNMGAQAERQNYHTTYYDLITYNFEDHKKITDDTY